MEISKKEKKVIDSFTLGKKRKYNLEKHDISNLICRGLCNEYSSLLASNITRVASERIFHDPYYSLKEPISNSIDSYRSGDSSIGKFGMGFFSLLYWLKQDSSLVIFSKHKDSKGWICRITKDGDKYLYQILIEDIDGDYHGTKIALINVDLDSDRAFKIISDGFSLISDIRIIYTLKKKTKLVNRASLLSPLIEIIKKNGIIIFQDRAEGMPLNILYEKLLIPSISTKTVVSERRSEIPEVEVRESDANQLIITVGGIGIYGTSKYTSKEKCYNYYLNLPIYTPIPISRDDIILEKPEIFDLVLRQLFHLCQLDETNLEVLMELLDEYVDYASDIQVSRMFMLFKEGIKHLPGILLVPTYISSIIRLLKSEKKILASDYYDIDVYEQYIRTTYPIKDGIFINMGLVLIEGLKKLTGKTSFMTGISSLLFVDQEFTTTANWVKSILLTSDIILTPNFISEIDRIVTKDEIVIFFNPHSEYLDKLDEVLLPYHNLVTTLVQGYKEIKTFEAPYNKDIRLRLMHFIIRIITDFLNVTGDYKRISQFYYSFLSMLPKKKSLDTYDTPDMLLHDSSSGLPGNNFHHIDHYINFKPIPGSINYLMGCFEFFAYCTLNTNISEVYLLNVLYLYPPCLLFYLQKETISELVDFFNGIPYIYTFYMAMTINIILERFLYDTGIGNGVIINDYNALDVVAFLYKEISSRYSEKSLTYSFITYMSSNDGTIIQMLEEFKLKIEIFLQVDRLSLYQELPNEFVVDRSYIFTANQLINFILSKKVDRGEEWLFQAEQESKEINFQVVDIVVNTGTSKNFIESILTELIQNSLDASRGKDDRIEINLTRDSLSVRDFIGIPLEGLISLMIPFLSSKKVDDESTGEMGTGFFNIYRQPYTYRVKIETRDLVIYANPVILNGRVIDIEYHWNILTTSMVGTNITVYFNENLSSVISDVIIYMYTFLDAVNAKISFNGEILKRKVTLVSEIPQANIYYTENPNHTSVILTNGVPHSRIQNDDIDDRLLIGANTGIIIDLKKGKYIPTQSRKRIGGDIDSIIRYAGYIKIIDSYSKRTSMRHIIHGYYYDGDPKEVYPDLSMVSDRSKFVLYYESDLYNHDSLATSIAKLIDKFPQVPTEEEIEDTIEGPDPYKKVIIKWFRNKYRVGMTYEEEEDVVDPILSDFTTDMVTKAWKWLADPINEFLVDGYYIEGDAPKVFFLKDIKGYNGFYDIDNHTINISTELLNKSKLIQSITKYKELSSIDPHKGAEFLRLDKTLVSYCGYNVSACTLVHEFAHSVEQSQHSYNHDKIKYSVGETEYQQDFDLAANEIWRLALTGY